MMEGQYAANVIALIALAISILAGLYSWWTGREGRKLERHVAERDDRVEKSSAYMALEVHSSEAFRYAGENCEAMAPYETVQPPEPCPSKDCKAAQLTRQYYYQCLNLFEVCSNFRRNDVVDKTVYASWVAWFHELLEQWYFRELWVEEMRENYTPDVRHIFDYGVKIFEGVNDPEERRREFYTAVASLFGNCAIIADWPDNVTPARKWDLPSATEPTA